MGDATTAGDARDAVRSAAAFHLAAIVDSSDDAIVSKTLDGIVQSWNGSAERLFGYAAEEIIGRSIRIIIPADRQDEEDEVLRKIRAGERVDHFETVRRRKDGSEIDISLTVSPVRDEDGRVIGASKIARDISRQKAVEAALRSAIEVKDQFLSMVSHELRTPISIIVGNGQLLLRRLEALEPEERIQSLRDIASQGERLQRIIENLLALTRARAGDESQLVPVDLGLIAQTVVKALQQREAHREIEFRAARAEKALGEPTSVSLVLENLITNALKYSPPGSLVEVRTGTDASGRPCVEVLDRGIGVPDAELEAIFEPFYRSEAAVRTAAGMGLGLAVCGKLIEAQRGEIWANHRGGGGSVFGFSLLPASAAADLEQRMASEYATPDPS
jgi:PAS domain S-box-containing protein